VNERQRPDPDQRSRTRTLRQAYRSVTGIRRRSQPGAPPGTLIADPAAASVSIHAMVYSPEALTVHPDCAAEDLAGLRAGGQVLWVDVTGLADIDLIERIGGAFGLHRLALEDVVNVHQRPKAEAFEDHVFIVARMLVPGRGTETEQVSFFLGDNYLITFQERPGDCFDPVRKRLEAGRGRIRSVDVGIRSEGGTASATSRISCDLLAVSGGWAPNVALFSQSRGKLRYDDEIAAFRPGQSWQAERSAGAANGSFATADCLAEGAKAGAEAAKAAGFKATSPRPPKIEGGDTGQGAVLVIPELPSTQPPEKMRAWIDLQDDVTSKDLRLAVKEGYRSVEHAKRYTTTGMGTDQGKVANLNAFAFLAAERGEAVPAIGTTTFRQPYKPVTFGALAGQHVGGHFMPRRTTPMHAWHRAQKATFEPVGDWLRARAYPAEGESFHDAVQRESLAARNQVGVLDASTLGKIDVRGPDAREFLNRVYTNAWMKLAPGKCRYGFMLGEDGMIIDDGVTACLADDHFHMTTTTGGAARVLGMLEDYLQTEWPDLKVYLSTVTEQWAVASLCGPECHRLVADLCDDLDPDPEKFEFMTWRDAQIGGIPVRVFRISFTGELSYEINIPATHGQWLWEQIIAKGAQYGVTPYGTEAMHLLRAEKGFVIVGQETDGTVTPHDLRMDWIVKKNGDFIGRHIDRVCIRPRNLSFNQ